MDVVEFFKQVAADWQVAQKCGFCWSFGAPLEESAVNKQQAPDGEEPDEDLSCCVNVLLADIVIAPQRTFDPVTTFQTSRADNHSFTLYVLRQDEIGKNNYNEIAGHPIEESKWAETLRPLQKCLTAENLLPFCEKLGHSIQITAWQMTAKTNYLDQNYTGWQIRATFKELIQ